ncbi:hypothetical protein ACQPZX_41595 [Actinoplanes sp. CA-142083]|uniref:hypothetical protein n=1 Tax=Actinoplanes sp. CA-142083 TaxID=3239903 RepID=UPI003D94EF3A
MSATRRILAAGLPAAAALVFAASPALAMGDHAARPAATASACPAGGRDNCDYGATGAGGYGNAGAETPGSETPGGAAPAASPTHTRGQSGYNTPTTPATVVPTSPSAHVDTVPPTTGPSTTVQAATPTPTQSTGGGVSAGHALPVTGAPMGAIISLGGLMVAAGVASVWYTRRRRDA